MNAYLSYVRDLGFYERPDYDFLDNLFGNILRQNGWPPDFVYDWDYQNVVVSTFFNSHKNSTVNNFSSVSW
jgi:hypothetical protein